LSLKNKPYNLFFFRANFRFAFLLICLLGLIMPLLSMAKDKDSLEKKFDYFRVGIDLSKVVASPLAKDYNTYEFTFDVHYKKRYIMLPMLVLETHLWKTPI